MLPIFSTQGKKNFFSGLRLKMTKRHIQIKNLFAMNYIASLSI